MPRHARSGSKAAVLVHALADTASSKRTKMCRLLSGVVNLNPKHRAAGCAVRQDPACADGLRRGAHTAQAAGGKQPPQRHRTDACARAARRSHHPAAVCVPARMSQQECHNHAASFCCLRCCARIHVAAATDCRVVLCAVTVSTESQLIQLHAAGLRQLRATAMPGSPRRARRWRRWTMRWRLSPNPNLG